MESDEILDAGLNNETILIAASKNKRFLNYLIDWLVNMLFLMAAFVFIASIVDIDLENIDPILDRIITSLLFPIYYILCEGFLKGKTLGKYFTKTRAVTIEGKHLSWTSVIGRSFSRIVPFEALSFLGDRPNGWHDRWSDTMVIDEKLSSMQDEESFI